MATISEIHVRFNRKVQAKQFEPAEAEISFTGTLDDGEDHVKSGKTLILQAREIVHYGLRGGTDSPAPTTTEQTAEVTVTRGDGTSETAQVPVEGDDAGMPGDTGGNLPPEDPDRERGKPSDGHRRRTNQQISYDNMMDEKEAKDATTAAESSGDDDGLPGEATAAKAAEGQPGEPGGSADDTGLPGASDGESPQPEADSGLPGDTSAAGEEDGGKTGGNEGPTADDLQSKITGLVPDKVGVKKVKEILAANGASRVSDVKPDKRQDVMDQLDMVAGG